MVPESGGFDPAEVFSLLGSWKGATFFCAPSMVPRLINAPGLADADTSNLKTIVYGGAPMYVADVIQSLDLFGSKLVQVYGQGEAPMNISFLPRHFYAERDHPRYAERIGSNGIARTDLEPRVVDDPALTHI